MQARAPRCIAALYRIQGAIGESDPDHRLTSQQELPCPLVDASFAWLTARGCPRPVQIRPWSGHGLHAMRQGGFAPVA